MLKRDTDYEGGARAVEARYGPLHAPPRASQQHRTINLDATLGLHGPRTFAFRTLRFAVDALPWRHGIAIEYLDTRIRQLLDAPLTASELRELERAFVDVFDVMWDVARPIVPWWRRWWVKRRNVFADATIGEYAQLASFYSECQMQLPALALGDTQGSISTIARRRRTTLPIVLRSLPSASAAGWSAATRAASITSSSGSAGSTSTSRGGKSRSRTPSASRTPQEKRATGPAIGG